MNWFGRCELTLFQEIVIARSASRDEAISTGRAMSAEIACPRVEPAGRYDNHATRFDLNEICSGLSKATAAALDPRFRGGDEQPKGAGGRRP